MYADPSLIRERILKIRLTADELRVAQAAADKLGVQLSEFCRTAALLGVVDMLVLSADGDRQCKSR